MPPLKKSAPALDTSKQLDRVKIEAAVKKPRGIRQADPDSILSQLISLEVGATFARAERLDETASWEDLVACKARVRATMSTQVARANKTLAGENGRVSLSIGDFRSQDGDTLVCATVTRVQ